MNGPSTLDTYALDRLVRHARRRGDAFGGVVAEAVSDQAGDREFSRIVTALHKSTYDALAPHFHRQRGPHDAQLFLEAGLEYLNRRGIPRSRFLDWGCGGGTDSWFAASLGHEVVGIDISPKMIAMANARRPAGFEGGAPTFRTVDLLDPEFGRDEELFDLAIASAVVHNLTPADAFAAVQKILRLLRPGGFAIFSTTNEEVPGAGIEAKEGRSDLRRYRIKFTRDELVAFLKGCGFEISHVREFSDPHPRDLDSRRWVHVIARRPDDDDAQAVSDGHELAEWLRAQHRAPATTALWRDEVFGRIVAFGEDGWHVDETPDIEFSLQGRAVDVEHQRGSDGQALPDR